jgi:peptidoglycan/xylan/chitin deacetylase (PgdA/CDA1 family)
VSSLVPRAALIALAILVVACQAAAATETRSPAKRPGPVAPLLISHGDRSRPRIAVTFDADMTQQMLAALRSGKVKTWYDQRIVQFLRATHTPATIFLTGLWTRTYPDVVRSLAHDPLFELENHSFDHAAWTGNCYGLPGVGSIRQKLAEVLDAADEIARVTGRYPRYFRFPGGCYMKSDVRLVAAAGEQVIGWDVVSGDPFQPDPAPIARMVLDGVKPGSIIVMHLMGAPNAPATAAALKIVVPALKARGYRFVTVQALLAKR